MRYFIIGSWLMILAAIGFLPLACSQNQVNPTAPGDDLSAERLRRKTNTPTRTPTRTFTPSGPTNTFTPTPTSTWTPGTPTPTFTPPSSCNVTPVACGPKVATEINQTVFELESACATGANEVCATAENGGNVYAGNGKQVIGFLSSAGDVDVFKFVVYPNYTGIFYASLDCNGSNQYSLTVAPGTCLSGRYYQVKLVSGNPGPYRLNIWAIGTATPTTTSTRTATPTLTPTRTPTPCPTCNDQICPATPITVAAGSAIMNYGQARAYVIRDQADWDAYRGAVGTTPPVNFASQMVLAVNWGTEYCAVGSGQPVQGRVVTYSITSACENASSISVIAPRGTSCTCGASCVYTMAGNQVVAAVLPVSTKPVTIAGVADVVQNLP